MGNEGVSRTRVERYVENLIYELGRKWPYDTHTG